MRKKEKTQQAITLMNSPLLADASEKQEITLEPNQEILFGAAGTKLQGVYDEFLAANHCCVSFEMKNRQTWLTNISEGPYCYRKIRTGVPTLLPEQAYFVLGSFICHLSSCERLDIYSIKTKQSFGNVLDPNLSYCLSRGVYSNSPAQPILLQEDYGVSSMHALLQFNREQNSWTLTDRGREGNGSRNGTFVSISSATIVVQPAETYLLGSQTFLFLR